MILKILIKPTDAYPFGEYHHAVMKEDFSEETLKNYLQKANEGLVIKKAEPDIEDCFMSLMTNPRPLRHGRA